MAGAHLGSYLGTENIPPPPAPPHYDSVANISAASLHGGDDFLCTNVPFQQPHQETGYRDPPTFCTSVLANALTPKLSVYRCRGRDGNPSCKAS